MPNVTMRGCKHPSTGQRYSVYAWIRTPLSVSRPRTCFQTESRIGHSTPGVRWLVDSLSTSEYNVIEETSFVALCCPPALGPAPGRTATLPKYHYVEHTRSRSKQTRLVSNRDRLDWLSRVFRYFKSPRGYRRPF